MSKQQSIDYDALAKQNGAVDYDALAKENGAISSAAPNPNQAILDAQKQKYPTEAESGKPIKAGFAAVADNLKDYLRPAANAANDFFSGIGKSAIRGVPLTTAKMLGTVPKNTTAADIGMQSDNLAEDIGGGLERIGEFMVPGETMGKIAAAGKLGMAGRAGLEAVSAYGVSTAHGDSNNDAVRNALVSGGLTLAGSLALKGLGMLGQRMELSALKPTKEVLDGVKGAVPGQEGQQLVRNAFKYDLGGSMDQALPKAEKVLDNLNSQLKAALGSQPGARVNLYQAVNDAALELEKAGTVAKNAAKNEAIQRALLKQIDDIDLLNHFGATQNGAADLNIANQFKRGLGQQGSWLQGFADPDNEAKQIVANAVYKKVREGIEAAAGQSGLLIRHINDQMSEVLPVRDALIRRIPVAARRDIVGLKEALGAASGNVAGAGLSILDHTLRSPAAANVFVKGAAAAPAIAPRLGEVGAALKPSTSPEQQ